jgi:hypothetical protein
VNAAVACADPVELCFHLRERTAGTGSGDMIYVWFISQRG